MLAKTAFEANRFYKNPRLELGANYEKKRLASERPRASVIVDVDLMLCHAVYGQDAALPTFDFTSPTSPALMLPLAFTSLRKLVASTG